MASPVDCRTLQARSDGDGEGLPGRPALTLIARREVVWRSIGPTEMHTPLS